MVDVPLNTLDAHALNSNVMPPRLYEKLKANLAASGRYPPIIVRPIGESGRYQILDGHHRVQALRELGHCSVQCVVWDVEDDEALVLLATLNRLSGEDDPRKRARLVAHLQEKHSLKALANRLPERVEHLARLRSLLAETPPPAPPALAQNLPVPVHFFLSRGDKAELDMALRALGGPRDTALMTMVRKVLTAENAEGAE